MATRSSSKALGKDHALSRRRSARLALQENALPSREVVNSQSSEANQRKKRNSSSSRGTSTGLRDRVAKRARCVNGGTDIRASCSRSQNSLQRTSLAIHSDEQETITSKKRRSSGSRASSTPVEAEISSRNNFVNEDDYCLRPLKFDPSKLTRRIAPHDARNRYDVLEASDYVTDIFQRLFAAEESFQARPYLEQKEGITPRMRSILVDWLVQVQHKLNFVTETLYLAVSLFDRYVSQVEVSRNRLQLVGVTALLIASKYEDIFPPEVKELVYICDRAYTHQDLLDMEIEILKVLQYRVSGPTAYPFMCRFLTMMQVETNSAVWFGSNYYLDRMLQEANSLEHRPSLLALGSVVLALNNHDLRSHDGLVESTRPGIVSDFSVRFQHYLLMGCSHSS